MISLFDGCLYETEKSNLINLDLVLLRELSGTDGLCSLYWDDNIEFTIEKEFLISLSLNLGVEFFPGHFRKLRYFPSENIKFIKEKGAPGWYRMYEVTEETVEV